jgi:hypothetical protein
MALTKHIMPSFDEKPAAKFLVPDWRDKVHLVGRYDNPVEELYYTYSRVQSVCPFVRLPQARVSPPWNQRGEGGQHSLAAEGAGGAISDD